MEHAHDPRERLAATTCWEAGQQAVSSRSAAGSTLASG